MTKPSEFTIGRWPEYMPKDYGPPEGYPAVVNRVIDGDTFVAVADVGLETYPFIAVRIAGVNTPESWEPEGDPATVFLMKLILDQPLYVKTTGRSFSRWVANVTLEDGRDLADVIIEAGYGERV